MSFSPNAQQIEYWNGPVGERWARRVPDFERNMASITAALLPFAAARPGERVLDIGCGTGTTTMALARAVQPGGTATGIDISQVMLAKARERAEEAELGIEYIEADASTHPFAPRYNLLFSRFGIMFFADPVAGFANLRHALKPEGRVAFVCWQAFEKNVWALEPYKTAQHLLPPQEPSDPYAPGPFAFADANRVKSILTRAGFRDVRTEKLDTQMNMGPDTDHAAKEALLVGPLARAATGLPDDQREKIHAVVMKRMEEFLTPAGVTPPAACWLVGAFV
jgi:ubiquinone/menaquinone biosynthesis C-methylase UbiE